MTDRGPVESGQALGVDAGSEVFGELEPFDELELSPFDELGVSDGFFSLDDDSEAGEDSEDLDDAARLSVL